MDPAAAAAAVGVHSNQDPEMLKHNEELLAKFEAIRQEIDE